MSYELHKFAPGETLYASDLNEMDVQIRANANAIEQMKTDFTDTINSLIDAKLNEITNAEEVAY